MTDIRERLKNLIEKSGLTPKELEEKSGLDRMSWANVKRNRIRVNQEHIEAAVKLWPEYAYWLTTGNVITEAGQISPEIDTKTRDSKWSGTAGK